MSSDFHNIPKEEIQRAFREKGGTSLVRTSEEEMELIFEVDISEEEFAQILECQKPPFIFGQPDKEFML